MADVGCGFVHEDADGVVATQVAPDLLADEVRRLGAQDGARDAVVGFEFVEGRLDLPALPVGGGEVDRRRAFVVETCGEEMVRLLIVHAVRNDVDPHWWNSPPSWSCCRGDVGEPRAVRQVLDVVGTRGGFHPPQQISASGAGALPYGESVQSPVC